VMFDIKSKIYVKDSKCIVMASNKALYEFFLYECGNGAENKRIPSFMFSVDTNVKKAFINAYFNGDGSEHYTYGAHKGYSKDSKTVSKWLSIDLYYLLLQLNINPRFSIESGSQRDFGKYISDCKDAYSICYSSKSIVDANGFRGEKTNKTRKIGDLSLVKITKIEEVQSTSGNVYDLSVKGYENFIGGIGMVLHNTGEGGAVLTNDGRLFSAIRSYANWGRDCWCDPGEENTCGKRFDWEFDDLPEHYDHKYVFSRVGYNMKMTELQAALGMAQMARVQNIVRERRSHYRFLFDNLSAIPNFKDFFSLIEYKDLSSPFGFPIYAKEVHREDIVSFLEKRKIKTRPVFSGNITHQPMLRPIPYDQVGALFNCDRVMYDMFWVGCHPELTHEQLDYIVESFADFIGARML
jgi:hypothetical protein